MVWRVRHCRLRRIYFDACGALPRVYVPLPLRWLNEHTEVSLCAGRQLGVFRRRAHVRTDADEIAATKNQPAKKIREFSAIPRIEQKQQGLPIESASSTRLRETSSRYKTHRVFPASDTPTRARARAQASMHPAHIPSPTPRTKVNARRSPPPGSGRERRRVVACTARE